MTDSEVPQGSLGRIRKTQGAEQPKATKSLPVTRHNALLPSGANYWTANGFAFFKAENRGTQPSLWLRWKLWRELKRIANQEAVNDLAALNQEAIDE